MEIRIIQLSKRYGKVRALENVSLHITGGMYGLLGPNGAGKTTLIRILATLLLPTSGEVWVEQFNVLKQPARVRRFLGYIPQDFGFYKDLNAYELLDYIGMMKNITTRERKLQVQVVLDDVSLSSEAHRRVGTYSGGMKQRLGIAQALMGDPQLLVVDEPTAGLDPEERIHFRNLLANLSSKCTVLLSTHIVGDIEASCSGVAVLKRGRLVFNGSPNELAERARGKIWQVEIRPEELNQVGRKGHIISSRVLDGTMRVRIMANASPMGHAVQAEPNLEDGYLTVMQNEVGRDGGSYD